MMKNRQSLLTFAAVAVAMFGFTAKGATYSLRWIGGGEQDADGYYHLEDDANWSGGVIKLSDQEVYNLTFPWTMEGAKILMPSVDKNFKGDMKFEDSATYQFKGNGQQAFEFRGILSLGGNASVRFADTTIRFGTGGGDGKIIAPSDSLLVFDNSTAQLGSGGTSQNKFAGDMQVLNGSSVTVPTFTVASDAILEISGGSTFTCGKNLYLNSGSKTIIDDSLFAMTGEKPLSMVGDIVFRGANARFLFKSTSNISGNSAARLIFEVPANGYNYIPFASISSSAALPNSNPLHLVVSKESPIYATEWNNGVPEESATIVPLVGWSKGTKSGLAADTPDLTGLGEDVACVWYRSDSATTDALAEGAIPDGLSWTKGRKSGSSECYIGVYIKGAPTGPVPPALNGAIATEAGADGKSFSATVAVTDLGKNFDSAEVTPQVVLRYRATGATGWIDAGAANVTATGAVRFDVTLPEAVNAETEFDVQAISHVTVDGEDFDSAPIAGSVTLEPAASDAPAFADDGALVVKSADSDSLAMTVTLTGFGEGANGATVKLMLREVGESGDGTEAATANLTTAGAVDLAAANLAPGTPYEVRVVATNDKAKTVATAWTAVSTLAVAPTLAATSVTDVGYETITVASGLDALGAKGVTVTLNLYLREGTSGNGAVVATSNVTAVGAVELTAGDLTPETAYQAKVVASYALDEEVHSSESAWLGLTTTAVPPQFASFAADGAAGDAIRAGGALKEVAGAVVVEISKAEDFASLCDSFDAGEIAAEGAFAHTFQTVDTTAANYIAPGETYYVRAVATKGGLTTVSDVIAVTTAAGSTAVVTTFTHSSSNVTIVGTLDPKGAGTTEVHVLWCEDGVAYDKDVTVATIGPDDDPDWEWSTTLDDEDVLFCYRIYTKNACATASWQTEPVTGKDTDLPIDTSAKYKWVADADGCFDGAWTDRAHWQPVKADGSVYHGFRADYPDQDTKNVKPFDFSAIKGTNAVVILPATAVNWGTTDDVGAENASVTFKGTPGQTVVTFSNTSERHMELAGEKVVLDGLSITFPSDLRMRNVNQTLVFKDGAVVAFTANNQSLHVQNTTTAGLGSTLIVDNATLDMPPGGSARVLWLGEGSKETTPVKLIVRGKHPLLKLTGLHTSTSSSLRPQIVFEIPEGGYAETPIVGYDKQKFAGRSGGASGKAIDLVVDRASPLMTKMTGRKRTYTLINWAKGFHSDVVGLDHGEDLPKTRALDMYYDPKEDSENEIVSQKVKVFVKGPDGLVLTITGN